MCHIFLANLRSTKNMLNSIELPNHHHHIIVCLTELERVRQAFIKPCIKTVLLFPFCIFPSHTGSYMSSFSLSTFYITNTFGSSELIIQRSTLLHTTAYVTLKSIKNVYNTTEGIKQSILRKYSAINRCGNF